MNHTRRNELLTIFYEAKDSMDDLHQEMKNHQRTNYKWHREKIEECRKALLRADRMLRCEQQK